MTKSLPPLTVHQYLAGKVKRWHTCIGLEQTNADHSHGVIMVIALLHPNPSANLLKAAAFHDMGEYKSGDMPSTAKRDPVIADRIRELEAEGRHEIGIPDVPLTDEERHWLAFADAYEAFMFLSYVGDGVPAVPNIEHAMITDKIKVHANALDIKLDVNEIKNGSAPQNGAKAH